MAISLSHVTVAGSPPRACSFPSSKCLTVHVKSSDIDKIRGHQGRDKVVLPETGCILDYVIEKFSVQELKAFTVMYGTLRWGWDSPLRRRQYSDGGTIHTMRAAVEDEEPNGEVKQSSGGQYTAARTLTEPKQRANRKYLGSMPPDRHLRCFKLSRSFAEDTFRSRPSQCVRRSDWRSRFQAYKIRMTVESSEG